ncbi:hypothetical protein [Halosegnis marinus]|uniref:hypothetical protein n=1 Tax=Halosegnis marinus TaxID=3034023 RepID=UPI003617849F
MARVRPGRLPRRGGRRARRRRRTPRVHAGRDDPGLAVAFVVATTLSAAAVWALVRWALDLWLDTGLLLAPGVPEAAVETALMWEFVAAAVAGVAAGVAFERWLRRTA